MQYIMCGKPFKYFSITEIANNKAIGEVQLAWTPGLVEHGRMMDELREWWSKPMEVSSWFRAPKFNKKVGGDKRSCHLIGRATDILFDDLSESDLSALIIAWQVICARYDRIGGIEIYDWGVHFDSASDRFNCTAFRIHDNR